MFGKLVLFFAPKGYRVHLMTNWKDRLYANYISTGQAASHLNSNKYLKTGDYPRYRYIVNSFMPSDRNIKIVDLGCGHGALVYYLQSTGYNSVQGVDFSLEQVQLAHQLGVKNVTLSPIDEFLQGKEHEFDLVFMLDVLEHLERPELFTYLDLVYAALKPEGKAVFRVPNGEGLFGMRIRYGDLTHELCFTQRSAKQMLRATGFNKIKVYETSPVTYGIKNRMRTLLWNILTIYPRLLLMVETGTTHHVLSQNMWVVAQK